MSDKFSSLTLKQAIAVHIFYTSPDDENLIGKTLNGENWVDAEGVVESVIFRETGTTRNETLEELIREKAYKEILQRYNTPKATFDMVVLYPHENMEDIEASSAQLKEMNLTDALKDAFSPVELPEQIIEFLLEKEEYSFLKDSHKS